MLQLVENLEGFPITTKGLLLTHCPNMLKPNEFRTLWPHITSAETGYSARLLDLIKQEMEHWKKMSKKEIECEEKVDIFCHKTSHALRVIISKQTHRFARLLDLIALGRHFLTNPHSYKDLMGCPYVYRSEKTHTATIMIAGLGSTLFSEGIRYAPRIEVGLNTLTQEKICKLSMTSADADATWIASDGLIAMLK